MTKRDIRSLLIYSGVAVLGLGSASVLSSMFFSKIEAKPIPQKVFELQEEKAVLLAQNTDPNAIQAAPVDANLNPQAMPGSPQRKEIVVEGQKSSTIDLSDIFEDYNYNPEGKKDPFEPFQTPTGLFTAIKPIGPVKPLQNFDLDQLSVTGIIWGVENPMAMVHTPNGEVYYVKEREKLGRNNGYVAQIREGEIVVVESFVVKGEITSQVKILPIMNPKSQR